MKKEDLTPKQVSSVPCPTCGVPAGKRCILYSGGLRFEPHLIRKLSAAAALERKWTHLVLTSSARQEWRRRSTWPRTTCL